MKKKIISILLILSSLFLMSCKQNTKTYDISEYILSLNYVEDFTILQLSDIHLGDKDNQDLHFKFLANTINNGGNKPNLIVITGDLFTFASKSTATRFFKFIDSFDIPWTLVFGNHDEQCYFPIEWLTNLLNQYGSNCLFKDIQDDDVFGNSNFAINLMNNNKVFEQVILMDSNRYCYGEYTGYDYIKDTQIGWYEKLINYTTSQNSGTTVDSLLFCHIPLPEYDLAWTAYESGNADSILEYGEKRERVCCPNINSGLFDKMLELGSTKGMFVGHDHINNFRIKYKGIYLCYGIHSTDRIYNNEDRIGGHFITIKNDHTLSFTQVIHTYEEVI